MDLVLPLIAALIVSAVLVPVCREVATRLGYVSEPRAPRRGRAAALFGGAGLTLAMLICASALGVFRELPILLVCSAVLFLFALVSDAMALRASTKMIALVVIASVFLSFGYRLHWAESVTLDSIVTVFWIVGITSAFNLLDNMDGLCAGVALIAGTAFLFILLGQIEGAALLRTQYVAILIGALAGFLVYNMHPASVVMGDSGSLIVGLSMAAVPLNLAPGTGSDVLSFVAVPVLVLLIPLADAALVALSRIVGGRRSETAPLSGHSSHRLVAIGLSERAAVLLLWALAALGGLIGLAAGRTEQGLAGVLAATFIIGIALFAVYLGRVRVHADVDPDRLPGTITPLGVEFIYRRRLAEVVLDLVLVALAYYGAYRLVFDGDQFLPNFPYFVDSFPIVLGAQMVALFAVGAYRGMWRYFSLSDGVTFAAGVLSGIVAAEAVIFAVYGIDRYSQNVFTVYGMLLLILLVGSRASFRLMIEWVHRRRQVGRRLVIYGAGDAGSIAVRQLLNDDRSAYRIVGFIDDEPHKRNVRVYGYRVIGGYDHLVGMIMAGEVDAVTVTEATADMPGLAWLCAKHGVALYRLNVNWQEIAAGDVLVSREASVGWSRVPMPRRVVDDDAVPAPAHAAATPVRFFPRAVEPDAAPVRVAHIITRLILGGAQENTLYTAIGQNRDPRFDVTLVVGIDEAGEGNMFSAAGRAGVRTVVIPSLVREIRPLTDIKAVFDLYKFLKRGSFTVVHTHSSKAGIIGRVAARAAGVPVIVHTLHGLVFHEFQSAWKNAVYIALKRLCAPLTDKIISVSDIVSRAALARGIGTPDQHVTIYSGIELERFLSVRDRLPVAEAKRRAGIPPDAPVVGKIARLFPLKGHEQFLAAAVKIASEVPHVYFLLVGDGPLREQLRSDADRAGLGDRVVMVGRVPPEAVPDYIQAMDVVVHTSLREGIARVLPQAGAVGKPVVTFDLDGAPEVVRHGASGYLAPPVDVSAIALLTIELLRDPERGRAFGEAGRALAAEHFSVERMVEQINDVYIDLVARARARAGARAAHT
jgi:UDP-GlcNAc:undecaprenyl-phosphate GlcNAc-1-phosphate transferase